MDEKTRKKTFYVILLGLGLWVFFLIKPYLSLLFLAFVMTILFDPVYKWIERKTHHRGLASGVSTILVVFSIVVPLLVVVTIAANQAISFANAIQKAVTNGDISPEKFTDFLNHLAARYPEFVDPVRIMESINLESILTGAATKTADFLSSTVLNFLQNSLLVITDLTIFIMILGYLFPVRDRWLKHLVDLSPLDDKEDSLFLRRLESMVKSIVKGSFFIALVQGFLGGLMFWLLGIPAYVFWGLMMSFASLIPLGSGIVWTPASIILLSSGHASKGIVLFVWGVAVISTVDNIIRGWILEHEESHVPPLLTLLSVLGGIRMFGFLGFLYGPVIMMLFLTAIRIYEQKRPPKSISHKSTKKYVAST